MASMSFLDSNAFMTKSGAQTLTFKSVTDRQTDELETVSIAEPLRKTPNALNTREKGKEGRVK